MRPFLFVHLQYSTYKKSSQSEPFPYKMDFLIEAAVLKLFLLSCCSVSLCLGESPTLIVPDALLIEARLSLDEDEVKVVDKLIKVTEEQLKKQEQLRELMVFFQKHKEEFVQGNQSKTQASRLVRTARQIQELIKENHLEHLFAKDYLDELQFFSSIAGKTTLSRP